MKTRFILAAIVFGIALMQTAVAMPTAQFTVTVLDQMQGYAAWDMNDRGDVVGWRDDGAGHNTAYRYANGQHQSLASAFGGLHSAASSINESGDICGWRTTASNQLSVLLRNGTATILPTGGFSGMLAHDINDQGDIVGNAWAGTDPRTCGFLYRNGTTIDIGTLGGHTQALAINDHGAVTGYSNSSTTGKDHVFRYANGQMTDLGTLGNGSSASDINNVGQIVGTYVDANYRSRPFLYNGTDFVDLGTLGGSSATASSLNDQGWIVGQSAVTVPSTYGTHAFLYKSGTMYDLNALIDPGLGLELYGAATVNDSGQILCSAAGFRTVLLTPVPEPATFGLVGIAALSCLIAGAVRRRKAA